MCLNSSLCNGKKTFPVEAEFVNRQIELYMACWKISVHPFSPMAYTTLYPRVTGCTMDEPPVHFRADIQRHNRDIHIYAQFSVAEGDGDSLFVTFAQ